MSNISNGGRAYVFTDAVRTFPNARKADANQIGLALDQLAAANDGKLEPAKGIEAASERSHPLHQFLTWDNGIAGHNWRMQEMRQIIRSVALVQPSEDIDATPRRGWLSIEDADQGVAYHHVEEVIASKDLQVAVMKRALQDLEAWEHRYRELEDICALVRAARQELARLVSQVGGAESRPSA